MIHTLQRIVFLSILLGFTGYATSQFNGPYTPSNYPLNVPAQITTDHDILFPPNRDIRLMTGDLVSVTIYGATDYVPVDRVSLDGYLRLPLVGPVQVQGLSLHEAEQLIATRLERSGMYTRPQVILTITDSPNQIATLAGEMHGVVPVLVPRRLYDVLSMGGGLPTTASRVITIHRRDVPTPIVVDLGNDPVQSQMANIPIFSGDTIVVSAIGQIYLLGAFKTQHAVPLSPDSQLTAMQAASAAGGLPFEAKRDDAFIIRTQGNSRVAIPLHFKQIMEGKEADPIMQADDIIMVPTNSIRAAMHAGGLTTVLGISSVLVTALLYSR